MLRKEEHVMMQMNKQELHNDDFSLEMIVHEETGEWKQLISKQRMKQYWKPMSKKETLLQNGYDAGM